MSSSVVAMGSTEVVKISEPTDDGLLDLLLDDIMKRDKRTLKSGDDLTPTVHVITRCPAKDCQAVGINHIIIPSRDAMRGFVERLPHIVQDLIMRSPCPDHRFHRYVGYIFTSACSIIESKLNLSREDCEDLGTDNSLNYYITLQISTEDSEATMYSITEGILRRDKPMSAGALQQGMIKELVNIFEVNPKQGPRAADPSYQ